MGIFRNGWISRLLWSLLLTVGLAGMAHAEALPIRNDVFWYAKDGRPINSQGGGIFRFPDPATGMVKYYWYGVHYKESDTYRDDPSTTPEKHTFQSVTCYSSTDLVNWTFENDVLTQEELLAHGRVGWVGRLGVAYVKELKKYALAVQQGNGVLFVVSDTPNGKFTWHQRISMKEMIGTSNTGDQTVFTDEDTGKSYLVYSYGSGRDKIYVSEIGVKDGMVNLLDCTQIFEGESREGNCMFKYQGRYYMCASNIYGWDSSYAYYLVADDIRGPYLPKNDMLVMDGCAEDYAHVTQTGFFVTIKGSKQETVVYCGDRWANFAINGLGYNQWVPISFQGKKPYFNSLDSWKLDAQTGEWSVAADNNYVRNGSFEADRRTLPNPVKPRQDHMTGWATTVLEGNRISFDKTTSPELNFFNTAADRKTVIGEKSLNLTDKVKFKRKVSQTITSTPFVKLEDGSYRLSGKVKNTGKFTELSLYAESAGKRVDARITDENAEWRTMAISKVPVRNGKVEIGFLADGEAGASCRWDDVSLIREP